VAGAGLLVGLLVLAACGSSGTPASKVATLGSSPSGGTTTTTMSPASQQDAILKYAACMRTNGVDMKDPTFDANGNMTGGGLGRNSGVDRNSTTFQAAQKVCRPLIQGISFGPGSRGGQFDRAAIQAAMNDFTACLRKQGLTVNDVTFGGPGDGNGNGNGNATGSTTAGGGIAPTGTAGAGGGNDGPPPGGFNGGPPGSGGDQNRPGGAGFDPTRRTIERLGLDPTDPAVSKAVTTCQPILTKAFTPSSTTTTG
jgi:hypothetical protein